MRLFEGEPEAVTEALKAAAEELEKEARRVGIVDYAGDAGRAAKRFFDDLRQGDHLGYDVLLVASVPESGIGVAVMDRMRKASGGNITII